MDMLRNEKGKAQEYLDSAHIIILVFDMHGHVSFIKKKGAAGLGYTEKEVIGKEWKSTILRDKKGKAINIHSSGNDITHRKNAERALLESSEKIKRFTYFVSHDLKNPAISLIGLTRCLKRKYAIPLFKMDRVSILRIFRNLVDNALKYGGDTLSSIAIGYEESGDRHVISVRDDGKGFDEQDRDNIFAAFTRSTASGDVYGTGLGLAIVKEIAAKHGGDAWAETAVGEGAIFYISIAKNLH